MAYLRQNNIAIEGHAMPVISFASPKGGSGKTTSAIILVCELAQKADGAHGEAQDWRYVIGMAEQATGPQQRSVASKRADQVGFIRKIVWCALTLGVCVYGKRQLLV